MSTVTELITEVQRNVEFYFDDINVEVEDIPRASVEDVLYGISLPETAINRYWDRLMFAAKSRCEQLIEFDRF